MFNLNKSEQVSNRILECTSTLSKKEKETKRSRFMLNDMTNRNLNELIQDLNYIFERIDIKKGQLRIDELSEWEFNLTIIKEHCANLSDLFLNDGASKEDSVNISELKNLPERDQTLIGLEFFDITILRSLNPQSKIECITNLLQDPQLPLNLTFFENVYTRLNPDEQMEFITNILRKQNQKSKAYLLQILKSNLNIS